MKTRHIQSQLADARTEAQVNPSAALRKLAALNVQIDFGLGRLTAKQRDVLLSNPDRAVVRLESQSQAFAKGTLIL